jgi:glycosyltransferase involved in cell wall biosynthesis
MLVENSFPRDTRVRNEAATLSAAGFTVSVIALRGASERPREVVGGVTVYRLPRLTLFEKLPAKRSTLLGALLNRIRVIVGYVAEYVYFTAGCFVVACYVAVREGVDVIHAHNPPDTLVLVGAVFKLFGKKFVFDHHDLCPELYYSRYKTTGGLVARALRFFEALSVKLADVVIATNESYRRIDIERNRANPDKVFIVRNGPDVSRVKLVEPDSFLKAKAPIILGYVGAMNPQDGVDYLLRALGHVVHDRHRKDFYCVLIGDGDSLDELKSQARALRIDDRVLFTGFIPDDDMVRYLSTADICLDPNPSSPLNDVSTWIKVMEYMALGKPVVSFDLKETRFSAAEAAVYVPPNDERQFAEAIVQLMDDPLTRRKMGECGKGRVQRDLGWHITSRHLLSAYHRLFPRARTGQATAA